MALTLPAPGVGEDGDEHMLLHGEMPLIQGEFIPFPLKNTWEVMVLAMRWPRETTTIWAEMEVMVSGSFLYQKNWFRMERRKQQTVPNTHMRKVRTGIIGLSLIGTVSATCSIKEFSDGGDGGGDGNDDIWSLSSSSLRTVGEN